MTVRVLIVSPDTGFGGLIQQTLEKSGRYEPVLVSTGRQALELTKQIHPHLAVLDADTADLTIKELGEALRARVSKLRLLLIPSGEPESTEETNGLPVNGYLTKPFYLPDLVDIVDNALEADPITAAPGAVQSENGTGDTSEPEPDILDISPVYTQTTPLNDAPWLGDINLAAQHLARLSLSTSSQAAMILRGGRLWAYAGELTQQAAEELAQIVQHGWKPGAVENGGADERIVELAHFVHLESTGKEYLLYATNFENDMYLVLAFDARTPFSEIRTQANSLAKALTSPPMDGLLDDEQPLKVEVGDRGEEEAAFSKSAETPGDAAVMDWALEFDPSLESAEELGWGAPPIEQILEQGSADSETGQEQTQPDSMDQAPAPHSPMGSAIRYDLHYACILLPRLPEHYLTGDLSARLSVWMRRLSLAFGWRLEYLALRPESLQWIAGVEPESSAEQVVQFIRHSTSDLIFREFPRYVDENPSDDFWAPGYLVMTSSKPLPGELVQEFIERTRLRQGISFES